MSGDVREYIGTSSEQVEPRAARPVADMSLVLLIFQTRYVFHLLVALTEEPCGFNALLHRTGIKSAGTLSARLRDLQAWQLVTRQGKLYALLPAGRASFSVLSLMRGWLRQQPDELRLQSSRLLQRAGSLAILHALLPGPLRVRDLSGRVQVVSRRSLLNRLQELTEAGFLGREGGPVYTHYGLTDWGQSLRPVLEELTVWLALYRALNLPNRTRFSERALTRHESAP